MHIDLGKVDVRLFVGNPQQFNCFILEMILGKQFFYYQPSPKTLVYVLRLAARRISLYMFILNFRSEEIPHQSTVALNFLAFSRQYSSFRFFYSFPEPAAHKHPLEWIWNIDSSIISFIIRLLKVLTILFWLQ